MGNVREKEFAEEKGDGKEVYSSRAPGKFLAHDVGCV